MDARDVEDLFRPFAAVAVKRMFGGLGIYVDGMMFAIFAGGEFYLKSDVQSAAAFDAAGLKPFEFASNRGTVTTSYRALPEAAHEDEDVLKHWSALALAAARRAAAAKGGKRPAAKRTAAAKKPSP